MYCGWVSTVYNDLLSSEHDVRALHEVTVSWSFQICMDEERMRKETFETGTLLWSIDNNSKNLSTSIVFSFWLFEIILYVVAMDTMCYSVLTKQITISLASILFQIAE